MTTNNILNTNIPLINPDRGWRVWNDEETWKVDNQGKHTPNLNDLIFKRGIGWFVVDNVDYTAGTHTSRPWVPSAIDAPVDLVTIIGGAGGSLSESFRLLLDTSVNPHVIQPDGRLRIFGTGSRYIKIFRGTSIDNSRVISRMYDNNMNLLGENIPLEKVRNEMGHEQPAEFRPVQAWSTESMPDNELCTVVAYNDQGGVVYFGIMPVRNTGWIRKVQANQRYVTGISLKSPFVSASDDKAIDVPINVPLSHVLKEITIHYNDGSRTIPIDGVRARLVGLEQFTTSRIGDRKPFDVFYTLGEDEYSYNSVNGDTRHIYESYLAKTLPIDGAYSVSIYTFPVWLGPATGYRLKHFLYNLDRREFYEVTNLVAPAPNSAIFDPTLLGQPQDLSFNISLRDVDSIYSDYRHVQTVRVTLMRPGDSTLDRWAVRFNPSGIHFGTDLAAKVSFANGNQWRLNLGNNKGSLEHWLRDTYLAVDPLFNENLEARPPSPNWMRIKVGNQELSTSIASWNSDLILNFNPTEGDLVTIHFSRKLHTEELQLGMVGMTVRRT